MTLISKIKNKEAKVAVIGLGYVGLPLAVEIARAGFSVFGIDINKRKIEKLKDSESYIDDVKSEDIVDLIDKKKVSFYDDYQIIKQTDVAIICVPTPLRKTKDPDISFITSAVEEIKKYMHKDMLIVLESTSFPGTTEEVIKPAIEEIGYKVGRDFFLVFSPERVDPGNPVYKTKNIPKVLGGVTNDCTQIAKALYEQVVDKVIIMDSAKEAEIVKLLENTFRNVNIAFINEFAQLCNRLGLDVWKIIKAASSKPFGFMPFYPGPGIGGHCIPCDPTYLSWKAKSTGRNCDLIDLATKINQGMPGYVADLVEKRLGGACGKRILVLGIAYKSDVSDYRESPGIEIMRLLKEKGFEVDYNDPHVAEFSYDGFEGPVGSKDLSSEVLQKYDCVLLSTAHTKYDYKWIAESARLILDCRNAFRNIKSEKIIKL